LAVHRDAEIARDFAQLFFVPDLVALRLAFCSGQQREGHVTAMVRVRRRAGRNGARQVAGGNRVRRGAADSHLPILGDAARAHKAVLAAQTRRNETNGTSSHHIRAGECGLQA